MSKILVRMATFVGVAAAQQAIGTQMGMYDIVSHSHTVRVIPANSEVLVGTCTYLQVTVKDGPVNIIGQDENNLDRTFHVRSLLATDQRWVNVRIINDNSTPVTVTILWASDGTLPEPPAPQPTDYVLSVNGNLPDWTGDVQVDTGVMTINDIEPDADGNLDTDDGEY